MVAVHEPIAETTPDNGQPQEHRDYAAPTAAPQVNEVVESAQAELPVGDSPMQEVVESPQAEVTAVGTLDDRDGAQLLIDRLGGNGSGGQQDQAQALSRMLAGMPLA